MPPLGWTKQRAALAEKLNQPINKIKTTSIGITPLNNAINDLDWLLDEILKRNAPLKFKIPLDKPDATGIVYATFEIASNPDFVRMWVNQTIRPICNEMMRARMHSGPKA